DVLQVVDDAETQLERALARALRQVELGAHVLEGGAHGVDVDGRVREVRREEHLQRRFARHAARAVRAHQRFRFFARSARATFTISTTTSAASAPLFTPGSPGFAARSSACSTVSVVSTQNAIGMSSARDTRPTPSVTPWQTYSK